MLLAVLCGACRGEPPGDHGLSARIAAEVQRGSGTVVDLHALAPFRWSRFYVFGPYRTQKDAERVLGKPWPYEWGAIEYEDDRSFLVFTDSGHVVAAFDQVNDGGNLMGLFREAGYSPDSARFVVRERERLAGGAPNYELVWHP